MDLLGEGGQRLRGCRSGQRLALDRRAAAAMVWFNLSLAVGCSQPRKGRPKVLEQLRLLPQGQTPCRSNPSLVGRSSSDLPHGCGRAAHFAFTSFALVRWLAPDTLTLEVLLAEQRCGHPGLPC